MEDGLYTSNCIQKATGFLQRPLQLRLKKYKHRMCKTVYIASDGRTYYTIPSTLCYKLQQDNGP